MTIDNNKNYIDRLKSEEKEILLELKFIRNLIAKANGSSITGLMESNSQASTPIDEQIDIQLLRDATSDKERFLAILKIHKRFMKIVEMANYLTTILGQDNNHWKKKLTRVTGKLKELNKITMISHDGNKFNCFWGSPNWIDDGQIINEYMYDKSSLKSTGKNKLDSYEM